MSSAHRVIIARNTKTGRLEFPLGYTTLYGADPEGEEGLLHSTRALYSEDWTLAIYEPQSSSYAGSKK